MICLVWYTASGLQRMSIITDKLKDPIFGSSCYSVSTILCSGMASFFPPPAPFFHQLLFQNWKAFVSLQSEQSQPEGVGSEGHLVTGSENVIGQTGKILLPGLSDIHHLDKALASSSETPPATCDAGCPTF